jgi:NADPH-dependent glutamate synthase beta subunit-like oxidoreductase
LEEKDGKTRAVATTESSILPAEMIVKSIGYVADPINGLPFDSSRHVIPNDTGRVVTSNGEVVSGAYVAGWIKRGPSGIIGTNLFDATETVETILKDLNDGRIQAKISNDKVGWNVVREVLRGAGVKVVDKNGWRKIRVAEDTKGKELGKVREKMLTVEEMLQIAGV